MSSRGPVPEIPLRGGLAAHCLASQFCNARESRTFLQRSSTCSIQQMCYTIGFRIEVLRSDRFAFEHNSKKNLTLSCLQKVFVDSMIPLSSCDDVELHGWSLHLTVSKGDWKHKREWLSQARHYGNVAGPNGQPGQICPRCLADSSRERPWADMAERFNNQADLDEAASTSSSVAPTVSNDGQAFSYFMIPVKWISAVLLM